MNLSHVKFVVVVEKCTVYLKGVATWLIITQAITGLKKGSFKVT